MANEVKKQPTLQQRIAERQNKRAEVGKEAQVRTAAAWTIAKTMLPTAPAAIQKKFAATLLANGTKVLKAALRQTAINAHYTKLAETLKEVHKIEMNALMEDPSILNKERSAVKGELKGDAKAANAKVADDREAAGPQKPVYDEGARKEPARMDAENAGERKADTVDKTEGGEKIQDAVQDSARAEVSGGKSAAAKQADVMGGSTPAPAPAKPVAAPAPSPAATSSNPVIDSKAEIRASDEKEAATEKESNFGSDGKHNQGQVLQTKTQTASAKKADEAPMPEAPAEAPAAEMPPAEAPTETPMEEAPAEALAQDEALENVKEKVEETQSAVQQLEQELSQEKSEELDLTGLGDAALSEGEPGDMDLQNVFSDENINAHKSNLANEHHEGADEDFFGPSASSDLEANLDESQFASLDDMFAHEASADPLASLFEVTASANVEGFEVVPSSTGEAANKFKAEHGKENRDSETDHDEDILSLLVEGLKEQDNDQERVKQDATPELETPAASKEASKKPVLKHIKASAGAPKVAEANVADLLFASIDAQEELRDNPRR